MNVCPGLVATGVVVVAAGVVVVVAGTSFTGVTPLKASLMSTAVSKGETVPRGDRGLVFLLASAARREDEGHGHGHARSG